MKTRKDLEYRRIRGVFGELSRSEDSLARWIGET